MPSRQGPRGHAHPVSTFNPLITDSPTRSFPDSKVPHVIPLPTFSFIPRTCIRINPHQIGLYLYTPFSFISFRPLIIEISALTHQNGKPYCIDDPSRERWGLPNPPFPQISTPQRETFQAGSVCENNAKRPAPCCALAAKRRTHRRCVQKEPTPEKEDHEHTSPPTRNISIGSNIYFRMYTRRQQPCSRDYAGRPVGSTSHYRCQR